MKQDSHNDVDAFLQMAPKQGHVTIWQELEISSISPDFQEQKSKTLTPTRKEENKLEISKLFLPPILSSKCKFKKFLVYHSEISACF